MEFHSDLLLIFTVHNENPKYDIANSTFTAQWRQTFSFPFSLLRHYQMPECFFVKNYCFWARATILSCWISW